VEVAALRANPLEQFLTILPWRKRVLVQQHVGVAEDDVDRSADLMGKVREEVVIVSIRLGIRVRGAERASAARYPQGRMGFEGCRNSYRSGTVRPASCGRTDRLKF
jgi:hypothetical protein